MPCSKDCEFLETILIGTKSFEEACAYGYQEYTNCVMDPKNWTGV